MNIKLSVLGVRGGFPAPNRRFMEFGGNTSCICLAHGDEMLCFDAGSGLASLCRPLPEVKRIHILISHVHIDHILGLYGLLSMSGGPEIHLYGGAAEGASFRKRLETALGRPYWPLELCRKERLHIHELSAGEQFCLSGNGQDVQGGVQVFTAEGNHPGGSILYRAELCGIRVTYALDCEMDEAVSARLTEFAKGSDLLVWDANFTHADKQPGWGHSTWEEGMALGRAAGARRILMTHYSIDYTDEFLQEQERLAHKEADSCIFAREGMVIEL